jgi:TonB family protein
MKNLSAIPRICLLFLTVVLTADLFSQVNQAQSQDHPDRRVVSKILPVYPEVAKRNSVAGVVRLEVTVREDGSVRSIRILGGSPILVQSATNAVYKWKFARARAETKEVIEIVFEN